MEAEEVGSVAALSDEDASSVRKCGVLGVDRERFEHFFTLPFVLCGPVLAFGTSSGFGFRFYGSRTSMAPPSGLSVRQPLCCVLFKRCTKSAQYTTRSV